MFSNVTIKHSSIPKLLLFLIFILLFFQYFKQKNILTFWSFVVQTASANPVNSNGNDRMSDLLVQDRTNYNHELLRMIFYHLRHQLKRSVEDNVAIDGDITKFINDKVTDSVCLHFLLIT